MALKKSDLYRSLWASCDELRGGMDASQYKDYILTLLFVKYVTDKAKADPDSLIEVPDGGSFDDLVALKGDKEIGDKTNKVIAKLADANDLRNVIDLADFNDEEKLGRGKELVDRLGQLISIFADLDFSGSRAEGDDLLGDAYEYLMQHFATESGKSKGQFYTPAEVSRVLAKVVGIGPQTRQDQTVYDPTCGSGSLLLKAAEEAPRGITIYGQEKDVATWALAKMNMILHGRPEAAHDIAKGDTITNPQFTQGGQLKTFDFAVANPPFSIKSWSHGLENEYGRFEFGRPPEKNGDYAFLLHILKSLKPNGKAAVILPHGVLFRGNAEAVIRKELVKRGYIKGIIGLPPNLFYGTGIPACIVVLDKENAHARTGVFMIDASKGFKKDGNKNRLRSRDIHKIVDVFNKQIEIERYSRMVPVAEIASEANDYNLNIPRYVDSSEPEDIQDLHAHLHGGIPERDIDALAGYWDAFPSLRSKLFKPNRPGYVDLAVDVADVQQTILGSDEYKQFADRAQAVLRDWFSAHRDTLAAITPETRPNELITELGDDLLARFRSFPLLDEYDVYEQLLSYWHETMHDDVFLVMNSGWLEASRPRPARLGKDKNGKPKYEDADIVTGSGKSLARYVMDLIPPKLVVARYLAEDKAKLEQLALRAEQATRAREEYVEEHAVEDGLLWDAVDDKGGVTQKTAKDALKQAKADGDHDVVAALKRALDLFKQEADAKKAVKQAQTELDAATVDKYGELSGDEVMTLVLEDKWLASVETRVRATVDVLTLELVARLEQLGDRYGATVGALESELGLASKRVQQHLAAMGGPMSSQHAPRSKIRDLAELVTKGTTPTSMGRRFTTSGVRFIKVETITPDGALVPSKLAYIDRETDELLRRSQLREGDVLFSIAGALGRSTMVEASWLPANTNQAFAIVRLRKGSHVLARYLLWALRSHAVRSRIAEINVQAAQANLSLEQVNDFEIPIPSLARQEKIAGALDDAEHEVKVLERLIAKKEDVKRGLMQTLLSGETRLAGFNREWSTTTTLGDLGEFFKGRGIKRDDVRHAGVPCIRYGELYTTYKGYTAETVSYVDEAVAATAFALRSGDLLFAGSGETRAEIGMCLAYTGSEPAVAGGDIVVLRQKLANPVYLALLMNTPAIASQKARMGQGDAVVHISSRALAGIEVRLPERAEQDAITAVLMDADAEIEQLRARHTKAQAIKQGMMQELLTGRTRLPVDDREAVAA
ncbi:MAG: type I restriction-modification system subunit M [Thermoleophilaceae bacterium]|nr:type I restriction-modification system subunit M [Thermoleophilaceae bacterium]